MNEMVLLKPKLVRLKLSGMLESLETRMREAMEEKWEYSHFLLRLCTDEVERRDNKQMARRLVKSELAPDKTLETFDFSFNPRIHKPAIKELATCSFIEKHECVFFLGPSGVGKSHLAQSLGHEACRRGFDTLYRNTFDLLKWIGAGRGDGTHERRLAQVVRVPLLVLDDFGLRPLNENQQVDLFELIRGRYETASTVITSNRDFDEWPQVFSNPLIASAAMDRLVHRAIKIVIEGKSYRVNSFIKKAKRLTPSAKTDT
jgi:DNA replication protein DnaC